MAIPCGSLHDSTEGGLAGALAELAAAAEVGVEVDEAAVKAIWQYCVSFDKVHTAEDFIDYVKKCQVDNNLFFNGSTGDSLAEQLKALYLKQEFTRFAYENQGLSAQDLQENFNKFVERTDPSNLAGPSWSPGVPAAEPTPMTVVSPSP